MKKHLFILIFVVILIFFLNFPYIIGSIFLGGTSRELIKESVSPNESYTLLAYQINSGATVDYSVEVYLRKNNKDVLIYNSYHEYEANIEWISDHQVAINGKHLDLSKNETYDWRKTDR